MNRIPERERTLRRARLIAATADVSASGAQRSIQVNCLKPIIRPDIVHIVTAQIAEKGMVPIMDVRILTEADAEAFWNIRLRALRDNPESFGASYEEILERGIAGVAQGLRKSDSTPDDATFGAFDGKTIVGIAGFRREQEIKRHHKGVIWGMYVPQELRGKGIGKALLQAAITYAKSLPGLEYINLAVVLTNREARHLFISLGFETYGLERQAIKLHDRYFDQELMTLRLT